MKDPVFERITALAFFMTGKLGPIKISCAFSWQVCDSVSFERKSSGSKSEDSAFPECQPSNASLSADFNS